MKANNHVLSAAVIAAIGGGIYTNSALAAVVADGTYNLVINTTPTTTYTDTYGTHTAYQFGKDGAWNSSFTCGGPAPNAASTALTDNNISVATNAGARGSSVGGDGWAGILGITVSGSSFNVNGVPGMGGAIDQTTGAMTLNVTGRLGASSGFPALYDERWNVDDCTITGTGCINNGNTTYQSFSTVSAADTGVGGTVTIHGAAASANGDVNGDGITDYKAILVSGGQFGSDWGGFFGAGLFEVWNVQLRSTATPHYGFNVDTMQYTPAGDMAQYASVPLPPALWLFGSGLLGLAGAARRKRK